MLNRSVSFQQLKRGMFQANLVAGQRLLLLENQPPERKKYERLNNRIELCIFIKEMIIRLRSYDHMKSSYQDWNNGFGSDINLSLLYFGNPDMVQNCL